MRIYSYQLREKVSLTKANTIMMSLVRCGVTMMQKQMELPNKKYGSAICFVRYFNSESAVALLEERCGKSSRYKKVWIDTINLIKEIEDEQR